MQFELVIYRIPALHHPEHWQDFVGSEMRTPPFTWRSGQPTQHIEPERQILTATKIQNVLSISEPCFLAIAIKNENFRLFKRLLPGWVQA